MVYCKTVLIHSDAGRQTLGRSTSLYVPANDGRADLFCLGETQLSACRWAVSKKLKPLYRHCRTQTYILPKRPKVTARPNNLLKTDRERSHTKYTGSRRRDNNAQANPTKTITRVFLQKREGKITESHTRNSLWKKTNKTKQKGNLKETNKEEEAAARGNTGCLV